VLPVRPQLIPLGLEVTVPVPLAVTDRVYVCAVNVAVTLRA
jgi:hypothetical protein